MAVLGEQFLCVFRGESNDAVRAGRQAAAVALPSKSLGTNSRKAAGHLAVLVALSESL